MTEDSAARVKRGALYLTRALSDTKGDTDESHTNYRRRF